MTYEEAIKNINALNAVCGQKDLYDAEFESALALAIDALEKRRQAEEKAKKALGVLPGQIEMEEF